MQQQCEPVVLGATCPCQCLLLSRSCALLAGTTSSASSVLAPQCLSAPAVHPPCRDGLLLVLQLLPPALTQPQPAALLLAPAGWPVPPPQFAGAVAPAAAAVGAHGGLLLGADRPAVWSIQQPEFDDATMVMHSCNNLAEGFHAACMQRHSSKWQLPNILIHIVPPLQLGAW